jgi:ABC-type nitrate/sulfonate/bicarbonate transport system substrate-binding protein
MPGGFKREGNQAGARPGTAGHGRGLGAHRWLLERRRCGECGRPEKPVLNVAVVPAVDSAGFFVALDRGLFKAQGLTVNFVPVSSSETAIASQVAGAYDITGGNYVSYIQAQQAHRATWKSSTRDR